MRKNSNILDTLLERDISRALFFFKSLQLYLTFKNLYFYVVIKSVTNELINFLFAVLDLESFECEAPELHEEKERCKKLK